MKKKKVKTLLMPNDSLLNELMVEFAKRIRNAFEEFKAEQAKVDEKKES